VVVFWFCRIRADLDRQQRDRDCSGTRRHEWTAVHVPLPGISDELIRVSLFLAVLGMYFAASIATDSTTASRSSTADGRRGMSLAARDVYLTLWTSPPVPRVTLK